MIKKRKHRVVVEITLEEPCTEREAVNKLRYALANNEQVDTAKAREAATVTTAITVWNVKSFSRVVTILKLKWIDKALRNYHGTSVRDTLYLMRSS